mgnify:CR=1 FL=1
MADREVANRTSGPHAKAGGKDNNNAELVKQLTRTIDLLAQQIAKTK